MPDVPSIEILTGDPFSWEIERAPSAVAIGVFDGVHRGHQKVLHHLTDRAREIDGRPIALTFDPHPLEFLDPEKAPELLTTIDQRATVMESCGVEVMGVLPFQQIRDLDPTLFAVEILSIRLNARWLTVGENFRFGRDRTGDAELLRSVGKRHGFALDVVSMVGGESEVISSTRIRALLAAGDVGGAAELLGRRFEVEGPVVHGEARGAAIGFPTANLHIPERMAVPANGVYAVFATVAGECHQAVVNIGVRPTFGINTRTVEAHIIDFDEDIYGEEVSLEFVAHLRPERRFDSLDALTAQIGDDLRRAVEMLEAVDD